MFKERSLSIPIIVKNAKIGFRVLTRNKDIKRNKEQY
jgi:hypothetical protein